MNSIRRNLVASLIHAVIAVVLAFGVWPHEVRGGDVSGLNCPDAPASRAPKKLLYSRASLPLTANPVLATQVQTLEAGDFSPGDQFGYALSVDADTAVVGAPYKTNDAGAAYVFERNAGGSNNWGQVMKLTASDGTVSNYFGGSVAISGDTIVVGATSGNTNNFGGAAYVFERNQGGVEHWGQVTKLLPPDSKEFDQFGGTVTIDGDTLVVTAPSEEFGWLPYAIVYQRVSNNWDFVNVVSGSDTFEFDQFGFFASIKGDTLVIGAPSVFATGRGVDSGEAYVFERNAGGADNWGETKILVGNDETNFDQFGISVALDGDTTVVGAFGRSADTGAAYVFQRDQGGAGNWGQVTKLTGSDAITNDLFGGAVTISGDTIVATAYGTVHETGAAYAFSRNQGGTNNWGELGKITATGGAPNDEFGFAVSLSSNTLVVGAPGKVLDTGDVYVFDLGAGLPDLTVAGSLAGGACSNTTKVTICPFDGSLTLKNNGTAYVDLGLHFIQTCKQGKTGLKCKVKATIHVNTLDLSGLPSHSIALYVSDTSVLDPSTKTAEKKSLALLAAFASKGKDLSATFKVPGAVDLTDKYIFVVIDPDNKVTESNETNNMLMIGPL
jgi:hypothetical protein